MKLFLISNFSSSLSILDKLENAIRKNGPDLIVFCGNVLSPGKRHDQYRKSLESGKRARIDQPEIHDELDRDRNVMFQFYNSLSLAQIPCLLIPGEFDSPLSEYCQQISDFSPALTNIHQNSVQWDNFIFTGYGGKIPVSENSYQEEYFIVQYPFSKVKYKFRKTKYSLLKKIMVFHTSPVCALNQEGNSFINELIADFHPEVMICPCIPGSQGLDFIQNTWIAGAGDLSKGMFSIFDTKTTAYNLQEFDHF